MIDMFRAPVEEKMYEGENSRPTSRWVRWFDSISRALSLGYGVFVDHTTQTCSADNTPTAMLFDSTVTSRAVSRGNPTSRILCENGGVYNFQFSVQLKSTTSSTAVIDIWPRVSGTDVADSATCISIASNTAFIVPAWNFVLELKAGDYFELMWASSHAATTSLEYVGAQQLSPFTRPAIPSIILTVTQVN